MFPDKSVLRFCLIRGRWPALPLCAIAMLAPEPAWSSPGQWTAVGPPGGQVVALVVDPTSSSTLLAATLGAGIFKSTDGGLSWAASRQGLFDLDVLSLVADSNLPGTFFAGAAGGQIFKTSDSGASWSPTLPEATSAVNALVFDPRPSPTLFAGTQAGVLRSTNGGATWTAVNAGLDDTRVQALAIDFSLPQTTLYAGTAGGVFKSSDIGENWSAAGEGLAGASVRSLATDPFVAGTAYAGTSTGVFKTVNGGSSWVLASFGIAFPDTRALAVDPADSLTLYAGTFGGGVFRTGNGAASWTAANAGLSNPVVAALAFGRGPTPPLFAGTGDNVFKTVDRAASWTPAGLGIKATVVLALATDPRTPAVVYAGTRGGGVFKTVNGGASWAAANSGLGNLFVQALAMDPQAPATLYAGTREGGIFKTIDGGASWSAVNAGLDGPAITALAVEASATVYAATSGGIFKTSNGGSSWFPVNTGIAVLRLQCLAAAPGRPGTVYAGTAFGLFKTADGGATWTAVNSGFSSPSILSLLVDPAAQETIYAGTGTTVFKSADGGESWAASEAGLTATGVAALAIAPSNSATLYAGMLSGGVFKTTDGGGSWTPENSGLTDPRIRALAVASPDAVYAGTAGSGNFKMGPGVACAAGPVTLCLNGGRFRVEVAWQASNISLSGAGQAVPLTPDTGAFWFFSANNLELVVKVVDGRAFNGYFWVFAGSLSDVQYSIVVTDTLTGAVRSYSNPQGKLASFSDTAAFPGGPPAAARGTEERFAGATATSPAVSRGLGAAACSPGPTTLCLNEGRFRVTVDWRAPQIGTSGAGQTFPLTSDTGAFWFFSGGNLELVVKVVDGRAVNGKFWVFFGALSNVEYTITVTDTQTGLVRAYFNPQGRLASVADTSAF